MICNEKKHFCFVFTLDKIDKNSFKADKGRTSNLWASNILLKVFIKDFFSKYNQIGSFPRIWSHLLKKLLMEKFIFCAVFQMLHLSVLTFFYYEDWNMLMDIFYSHLFYNSCAISKSYSELLSFIADPHFKTLFC